MSDRFTFFRSYAEALQQIEDPEEFRACVLAMLDYALDNEDTAGTAMSKMFMALVKPNIDTSMAKREIGRRGGEANRSKAEANGSKVEANGSKVEANPKQTEAKPKQTEANAKQNEANGKQTGSKVEAKRENGEANREKGIGNREEGYIESMSYDIDRRTDVTTEDVNQVVEAWNTLPSSVPKVSKIISGSKRDKMLRARIREYGLTPVVLAVEKVRESDFLCGRTKKGWTISFDWFIGPENFPKVREGNYGARSGTTGAEPMTGRDYLLQLIRGGEDDGSRDEQDPLHDPGELSQAL